MTLNPTIQNKKFLNANGAPEIIQTLDSEEIAKYIRTGVSGSFVAGANTITVTNGLITSIV